MADLVVTTPYKLGGASEVRAYFNDNLRLLPFTFVCASSYTTDGDTIATADMPGGYKDLITPWAIGAGPYGFKLDVANKKLMVFSAAGTTTAVQVASTTNIQTVMGTAAITVFFLVR